MIDISSLNKDEHDQPLFDGAREYDKIALGQASVSGVNKQHRKAALLLRK